MAKEVSKYPDNVPGLMMEPGFYEIQVKDKLARF